MTLKMFTCFNKNSSIAYILIVSLLAVFTQIVVLVLLSTDYLPWWHFVLVTTPFLAVIPLICLRVKSCISSLNQLLTNHTFPQLKAFAANGGELGKLSDAICELIKENTLVRARFSELRKSHLDLFLHLNSLSEWLSCATFIIDKDYRICDCNKKALNMFGYDSLNQLVSFNFVNLIADSKRSEFHLSFVESQIFPVSESVMLKKDGTRFTASIFVLPDRRDSEKNCFYLFIKESNQDREDQKHLVEKSNFIYNIESVSRLAGGIAHDFNNILGAASGYAEIINNRYAKDDKLKKYSQMILSACRRGSALSEKLLLFARKNKLVMSCIDINDSLSFLTEIFRDTDPPLHIKFNFKANDSCILGDIEQFRNALTNIAVNAKEAMPDGGELIITTENIMIDESSSCSHLFPIAPGYYVAILISDTGTGIDEQNFSHLFEPFYTSKERSRNIGLGLSCVYGIVKSHNGFIDVKSVLGEGTTFTLYFPVYNIQSQPTIKRNIYANKKILLVDDELIIREAIGETLSWLGFTVSMAESGEEAVKKLQSSPQFYDLVILDMIMPGMSGKDCIIQMKKLNKDIKILISTGFSEEIDQSCLMEMGISGILVKPFESAQLTQAIYEALSQETK